MIMFRDKVCEALQSMGLAEGDDALNATKIHMDLAESLGKFQSGT